MSDTTRELVEKYLLGGALITVLILGGGSAPSLPIDAALQVLLYLISAFILFARAPTRFSKTAVIFSLSILICLTVQLIPLPSSLLVATQGALQPEASEFLSRSWRPISLDPGRTLEQLFWIGALIAFFLALTQTNERNLVRLLPFVLVGASCHLVIAIFQYMAASRAIDPLPVLGFVVQAGLFANSNHFSTLIFVSIPLAFAWFAIIQKPQWVWLYVVLSILVLFAVGSQAGMGIALIAAVTSFLLVTNRQRKISTPIIAFGALIIGLATFIFWARVQGETVPDQNRWLFAKTTFEAIVDNLPFGTGFGTFRNAYTPYEGIENLYTTYVNHAHNDYLELVLEGGVLALALMALCLWILLVAMRLSFNHAFARLGIVSIAAILLHSIVDYPLRTMAVAAMFSYLTAIILACAEQKGRRPV